jgi:IclR family KDG regulon transcriptional repressor
MTTLEKTIPATIKSVDKALEVLEAFSELEGGIKLSCLSEKLKMNKSGVYRLLQVFKNRGYVVQEKKNGEYQLGMAAFMVGQNIVSNMEVLRTAKPVMEKLSRGCNETIYLAFRVDDKALFFENVTSLHSVNVMSLKGNSYSLNECTAGEVLLAFAGAQEEVAGSQPKVSCSETLSCVKKHGYSRDADRLGDGVASLSVPLLNDSSMAVASLCVVGPDFRFTDQTINRQLLVPLIDAAHTISARLGYTGRQFA